MIPNDPDKVFETALNVASYGILPTAQNENLTGKMGAERGSPHFEGLKGATPFFKGAIVNEPNAEDAKKTQNAEDAKKTPIDICNISQGRLQPKLLVQK